ncbi:MAG: efflux RND transporter periplasmic adaptor subunit [Gemmatimonadetes bacterium]|nr:efflux RND transporter periplasmic adaptor subunit [Gemmatimonadota bacterium]
MTRRTKVILAVVLVLALGGVGVAIAASGDKGTQVRTEVVVRRDLVSVVTASGYIQPKRKVDISADISGRVIQLAVEEGQWVNRGDLLLRIDPTTFQAAARRAEAAVAQARAQAAQARATALQAESALNRAEQIARTNELISTADLEQARTQSAVAQAQSEAARFGIAQAEAQLSEAREALRKTTIVAPMSGRVTRLNIEEGETAVVGTMNNPGSLLLTIADLSEMEARVKVDETDVPHLNHGDSATVRIDAFPGQSFLGRVTRIANSATQSTATQAPGAQTQAVDFEVVVTLQEPPTELRPDLSATAEIVTATRENALSVPMLALTVRDPEGMKFRTGTEDAPPGATTVERHPASAEVEGVFVVREGKAVFVPVQVGIAGDRYFEVRSGLEGGEIVVSGSYQAIRDLENGDPLRVQDATTNQPAVARGGSQTQEGR